MEKPWYVLKDTNSGTWENCIAVTGRSYNRLRQAVGKGAILCANFQQKLT